MGSETHQLLSYGSAPAEVGWRVAPPLRTAARSSCPLALHAWALPRGPNGAGAAAFLRFKRALLEHLHTRGMKRAKLQ